MVVSAQNDVVSETLAGVVALAARAHPPSPTADESALAGEVSRWVEGGDGFALICELLYHDLASTSGAGRGLFRLFASSEVAERIEPSFPIASRAAAFASKGKAGTADLLFRYSFAGGETDLRTHAAIDRLTAETLSGVEVTLNVRKPNGELIESRAAPTVQEVRRFLEEDLGSRISLPDLAEAFDIASPLLPLTGLLLDHCPAKRTLEVMGLYDGAQPDASKLWYLMKFRVTYGITSIDSQDIEVNDQFQGLGIGTRSLLAAALFAAQHRIPGWKETAFKDGPLVWPRLGAESSYAAESLRKGDAIEIRNDTQRVLKSLLDQYLPVRLLKASITKVSSTHSQGAGAREQELANEGLKRAYDRGLFQTEVFSLMERGLTRRRGEIAARAASVSFLSALLHGPVRAPSLLLGIGGMVFHPVR